MTVVFDLFTKAPVKILFMISGRTLTGDHGRSRETLFRAIGSIDIFQLLRILDSALNLGP